MSVYLDIAFLVNFLFDCEIIFLTLKISSKKIVYSRIAFAGILGGLEGVFVFFPYFRILSQPPVSFLVLLLMIHIAAKPSSKREFFESYLLFLVISFIFGGAMTFLRIKTVFGLLLILPIYLAILNIRKKICSKSINAVLCYKDRCVEKNAIYDSGNNVFYLDKPVIFGDKEVFCEIFGEEFNANRELLEVSYQSIGGDGVASGIQLEKVVVYGKSFDGAVLCLFDGDLKNRIILNGIMV